MGWFRDLAIMKKFAVVSVVVGIFLVLSFALFNLWMHTLTGKFQSFVDKDQAFAFDLSEMYAQGLQAEQATRNILLNPSDDKARKNYDKALADFAKAYDNSVALVKDREETIKQLGVLHTTWQEGDQLRRQIQTMAGAGQGPAALDLLIKQETPKWRECKGTLLTMLAGVKKEMGAERREVESFASGVVAKSIVLMVLTILLVVLLFTSFGLSQKRMVGHLLERLRDIASGEGDLTRRMPVTSKCEFGEVSRLFNEFVGTLHEIISQVAQNSRQVTASADAISTVTEQIATGAEEVAAQAGTVATASEQMAATSTEIAQNCIRAAESSQEANNTALKGAEVVQRTLEVMHRIADRVQVSARTVASLGSRGEQIGEIVGTIQDIADQTNLLALNAAIEAARAGEQGRGFAVVADEVRALAERTTKATKEIGEMIKAVQQETKSAVISMEEGVKEVENGTTDAGRSGEALENILRQIGEVTGQVNQIATAAEEQTATTSEITGNIQQMTEVIRNSTRGSHDSASAAGELAHLATDLQRLVGHFKLA
ncbi:hypothetical protein GURASL_28620 [Geotalea uraniireducens]|uniref:Methyl-accepting chemotaxis protein n=1 Tax=Geotalea uraniireducens TaxID=351604 RepID=A0ABN6VUD1_9BACT|nr:methyl-accepting chemotaxis protein [Geotalea uraniireducens]BDV43939.1 hypothetical protein GURASL_28620 [Geotalea uraniireducens]